MFNVCAFIAFLVAAIMALIGVKGVSVETVIGIIAIGGAFIALAGLLGETWAPATRFRRRVP